jgi:hypothetical protein
LQMTLSSVSLILRGYPPPLDPPVGMRDTALATDFLEELTWS